MISDGMLRVHFNLQKAAMWYTLWGETTGSVFSGLSVLDTRTCVQHPKLLSEQKCTVIHDFMMHHSFFIVPMACAVSRIELICESFGAEEHPFWMAVTFLVWNGCPRGFLKQCFELANLTVSYGFSFNPSFCASFRGSLQDLQDSKWGSKFTSSGHFEQNKCELEVRHRASSRGWSCAPLSCCIPLPSP